MASVKAEKPEKPSDSTPKAPASKSALSKASLKHREPTQKVELKSTRRKRAEVEPELPHSKVKPEVTARRKGIAAMATSRSSSSKLRSSSQKTQKLNKDDIVDVDDAELDQSNGSDSTKTDGNKI